MEGENTSIPTIYFPWSHFLFPVMTDIDQTLLVEGISLCQDSCLCAETDLQWETRCQTEVSSSDLNVDKRLLSRFKALRIWEVVVVYEGGGKNK